MGISTNRQMLLREGRRGGGAEGTITKNQIPGHKKLDPAGASEGLPGNGLKGHSAAPGARSQVSVTRTSQCGPLELPDANKDEGTQR